jgi:nucleotide-binding universal stress UspA family protein
VLAWSLLDQPGDGDFDPKYSAASAAAYLDQFVDGAIGRESEVERIVVNDIPARAVLDVGAGADLIVVGSRGLGLVKELALGSVSSKVVHHTTVPTVVLRGRR